MPKVSAKEVQRRIVMALEKYNRRIDRLAYGVLLVTFAVAWIAARAGMPFWQIAIVFLMTGVGLYLIVEDNMRHGHD
jgi:hypothetical protein